ncbi:helix-turn-helix domain-containing protein [Burkholderia latens]|uniref:helix-turn-helix domain-containing protein n=1 Tax=Burkholderia latens TaxID=488446 RepID=UPI00158B0412|nr:helix-turn-helix transcriptional regulator [Burkholderia latens]
MPLTAFGKAIRRARFETGHTQTSMASELGASPSYLSALENGSKTISDRWLHKIENFFAKNGLQTYELAKLAAISNRLISLDGLPVLHQLLIAHLAFSHFTHYELNEFVQLAKRIESSSPTVAELPTSDTVSALAWLTKNRTRPAIKSLNTVAQRPTGSLATNAGAHNTPVTWVGNLPNPHRTRANEKEVP